MNKDPEKWWAIYDYFGLAVATFLSAVSLRLWLDDRDTWELVENLGSTGGASMLFLWWRHKVNTTRPRDDKSS